MTSQSIASQANGIRLARITRIESTLASQRVVAYQALLLEGVDVSDNLDSAILLQRRMDDAHDAAMLDLIDASLGALLTVARFADAVEVRL